MTTPCIVGIDLGKSGAMAFLGLDGSLLAVEDMPCLDDGPKSRPAVNGPLTAAILWRWAPKAAVVEYVGARPHEARAGSFAFGRARGLLKGRLAAMEVPTRFLTPPVWKRAVGIPPGKAGAKDAARAEAIRRWPAHAPSFALVEHDGRAEAYLIGAAGLALHGKPMIGTE